VSEPCVAAKTRFHLQIGLILRCEHSSGTAQGLLNRADVTELGHVLTGEVEGRRSADDVTAFDSTGLALQDLAVALAALERADELDLPTIPL